MNKAAESARAFFADYTARWPLGADAVATLYAEGAMLATQSPAIGRAAIASLLGRLMADGWVQIDIAVDAISDIENQLLIAAHYCARKADGEELKGRSSYALERIGSRWLIVLHSVA